MAYANLIPPVSKRPSSQYMTGSELQRLIPILQSNIPLPIWICLGAVLQSALFYLPLSFFGITHWRLYAILPAILYLLSRFILAILVTFNILPNPYLKGSISQRYTALVPDLDGNLPSENDEKPNKNKVAVLLLGARFNHPLSAFGSPESGPFVELAERMYAELDKIPQSESGFLGQTELMSPTPSGVVENYTISYWRSIEHIHKYAAGPTHVEAIKWWRAKETEGTEEGGKVRHIGIMHEIFEAPAGCWESIYLNFQPTMLGATSYLRKNGEKGGPDAEEWVSPIVAASRGKLRGSRGRLGWDPRGQGRQVHEAEIGDY